MGWALLLLAVFVAAAFRLWELGRLPPGLYRDEAFNGLDALNVLDGRHALFFLSNNGREPLYIYLTALSIALFGRSALSVRLPAAVIGTLTTWIAYKMAADWFGRRVGILSAWLWAVTFWPLHLSRIGLRPITMPLLLALTFWLGTLAYRRQNRWLWLLAGLVYGAGFYTYLAMRFTPLLLLLLAVYLVWRGKVHRFSPGLPWFSLGAAATLSPLIYLISQQPELILGRSDQVSIFNPAINGGDFWGTLGVNIVRSAGLFFWRGDTILRHNQAGRPIFDLFMLIPLLAGFAWCVYRWRRPAAMALLLWIIVMLGPTILAEDAPHFLRSVGLLPVIVLIPAIGLNLLWNWRRLPRRLRQALVVALLLASSLTTVRDYIDYGNQEDVAFLFETAATDMALDILDEEVETAIFVDQRFWEGWPSIPFLVGTKSVARFRPEVGLPYPAPPPASLYVWPYGPLDFIPLALPPPSLISAENGSLARGDLDDTAGLLYVRYESLPRPQMGPPLANFDDKLQLRQASFSVLSDTELSVDLYWSMETAVDQDLAIFVHVIDSDGLFLAQDDTPPAAGHWPWQWWHPDYIVRDWHRVELPVPYDANRHRVRIGIYSVLTRVRLPIIGETGLPMGDSWLLED